MHICHSIKCNNISHLFPFFISHQIPNLKSKNEIRSPVIFITVTTIAPSPSPSWSSRRQYHRLIEEADDINFNEDDMPVNLRGDVIHHQ